MSQYRQFELDLRRDLRNDALREQVIYLHTPLSLSISRPLTRVCTRALACVLACVPVGVLSSPPPLSLALSLSRSSSWFVQRCDLRARGMSKQKKRERKSARERGDYVHVISSSFTRVCTFCPCLSFHSSVYVHRNLHNKPRCEQITCLYISLSFLVSRLRACSFFLKSKSLRKYLTSFFLERESACVRQWLYTSCTGWRRVIGCLISIIIFRKRALYLVALLRKMTCNLRHTMSLRHPVSVFLESESTRAPLFAASLFL